MTVYYNFIPHSSSPVYYAMAWVVHGLSFIHILDASGTICLCVLDGAGVSCRHTAPRLLHGPNLVVIGLSMGYETWPPSNWHHPFVIDWFKHRLGLPSTPFHSGLTWPVGIPTIFQTLVTVPLDSPNGRQMPAVRAVQRELWKSLHYTSTRNAVIGEEDSISPCEIQFKVINFHQEEDRISPCEI